MGIRSFIAVELDAAVRTKLTAFQAQLRRAAADVKWVEPENIHLTVKFLGDVADGDIVTVCRLMDEAVDGVGAFSLAVRGAGSFPKGRRPRVIWVAAREDGSRLSSLYSRLDKELESVGVAREGRPFVAHITLGRARSPHGVERVAEEIAGAADRDFGSFTVRHLTLFQSTLSPQGPTYSVMHRAELG